MGIKQFTEITERIRRRFRKGDTDITAGIDVYKKENFI